MSVFLLYGFQSKILFKLKSSKIGQKIYNFLNKKWFFDKIYNEQLGQFFFTFGYSISYKTVDRGVFEMFGPFGLSNVFNKLSFNISKLQSGYVYHYTFVFLVGVTFILFFFQIYEYLINTTIQSFEYIKILLLLSLALAFI